MYEVFNRYLDNDTWDSGHQLDEERFLRALSEIVRHPDFDAEAMAEYIRQYKSIDVDNEQHEHWNNFVDNLNMKAWAIRDFIRLNL